MPSLCSRYPRPASARTERGAVNEELDTVLLPHGEDRLLIEEARRYERKRADEYIEQEIVAAPGLTARAQSGNLCFFVLQALGVRQLLVSTAASGYCAMSPLLAPVACPSYSALPG